MKIDIFTKLILSVIAGALVVLVAQNSLSRANADEGIQRVAICGLTNGKCANVGEISSGNNQGTKVLLVVDAGR